MTPLNRFLKVLNKVGYPNPNILSISKMADYNLNNLLPDLVSEVGEYGANNFVENSLKKISDGKKGIKVMVNDGEWDEYAYIKIYQGNVDLEENAVSTYWGWGDTKLLYVDDEGNESYQTIEYISDNVDIGGWSEYEELVTYIQSNCNQIVYEHCGFGVWFENQI